MEKVSKILQQWGSWMVSNNEKIQCDIEKYKYIIPERIKSRANSSEEQVLLVTELMSNLLKNNKEDYELLINYYIFGKTFIQLAKIHQCSDTYIGKKLKKAEGIVEGMLIMSQIKFN